MDQSSRYLVIRADDVLPFTHPADPAYHSQHVLGSETTGRHDLLLNQGTVDAHEGLSGGHHPDNDEIYYIVRGRTLVDLGGDPMTGEGHRTYRLEPGTVVFIPAGCYHRLRNDSDDELVLLAIWPEASVAGANGIHDERLETWGTGFRLKDGRELVTDGTSARVVASDQGWDPLVSGGA
jgi:mannose-6-phosphate isomerase-like protein (cupin superfamily)